MIHPVSYICHPFHYNVLGGGGGVVVSDGVKVRGCELAGRIREGLAREACRRFPLVVLKL